MRLPVPFDYPGAAHVRRHGPAGYKEYKGFKDWLRDEFTFRCVYCLFREKWFRDGSESFSVDHVIPRSRDKKKTYEFDYNNLVYACNHCNSFRRDEDILNPLRDEFEKHLWVNEEEGSIFGLTPKGEKTVRILKLNKPGFLKYRREIILLLVLKREDPDDAEVHRRFVEEFGYPVDLPDLRLLRPPQGNMRPGSEETCYHALRERGQLGVVY